MQLRSSSAKNYRDARPYERRRAKLWDIMDISVIDGKRCVLGKWDDEAEAVWWPVEDTTELKYLLFDWALDEMRSEEKACDKLKRKIIDVEHEKVGLMVGNSILKNTVARLKKKIKVGERKLRRSNADAYSRYRSRQWDHIPDASPPISIPKPDVMPQLIPCDCMYCKLNKSSS